MKRGYRFTHMELYEKIKEHLKDYKSIAEIVELAELNKWVVIQKMRLIEDKKLVTSKRVRTNTRCGCTRIYKLAVNDGELNFVSS